VKPHGNLLAWITSRGSDEFVAALLGEGAVPDAYRGFWGRAPANKVCSSRDEARQWIEEQAAALDLPIKWVSNAPQG
jgi:hypothetical protein